MMTQDDFAQISIIIPAYDAAGTLAETLDSVAGQTCQAIVEVIVIDDGSQDDTAAIAAAHEVAPRVIRTDNRGAPSAINTGIDASRGEYICVLDADDIWLPAKLEVQLRLLGSRPDIDMVFGHVETFECPSIPAADFARLRYQKGRMPGHLFGTSMMRRSVFAEKVGALEEGLRCGYWADCYRRLTDGGAKFEMIDQLVLCRRIRPGTLSHTRLAGSDNRMNSDFLKVARRALLAKRKSAG